jgi:DNA-binding NarL/FixJ family response regulator
MSRLSDPEPGLHGPHSPAPIRTTIAFIEDSAAYRGLLEAIVGASGRYEIVGLFESAADALHGLPKRDLAIIVIDVRLRGHSGIAALAKVRHRWPHTRCVMLTNSEDDADLFAALAGGAAGYLLKSDTRQQIISALDEVAAGGAPLSRTIARRVVGSFAKTAPAAHGPAPITAREREVMNELARGISSKEISRRLGISAATVKNHLYRIYEKLGVRSRTEAVVKWLHR